MIKIALDSMGGDLGPEPVINGLLEALRHKTFFTYLVGDSQEIAKYLKGRHENIEVVHCKDYIRMEEQSSVATRRKDSSISIAIDLLKNKKADALISAGHSGASMSLATLRLGRIEGISRPAICTMMPTVKNRPSLVLDVGANADCRAEFLRDFGIMGYEYAKYVLKFDDPKVGLLSNGEEDSKGNELTKEAFKLLSNYPFFKGNVEGGDIFNGTVDVIICDGHTGNVVLKASEGVAHSIFSLLKKEVQGSLSGILGAFFLKKAFKNLRNLTDYAEYGGAPLLGVNGNVIISHGKSNSRAIECAIYQGIKTVENKIVQRLSQSFCKSHSLGL